MKVVSPGIWRPLRWLLVLLCVGGGVFAAENNWLTSLRVGHMSLTNWLARLAGDTPTEEVALPSELAKAPETNYAPNPWLNTALFAPAASGWTLNYSARSVSPPMFNAQQVSPTLAPSSLPTAFFSSGFITYTSGTVFGPLPTAPNVSGIWIGTASGNWSDSSKWSAGLVADGAGNTANFTLTDIANDVSVTLDTSRTIGNLYVGDTNNTHSYTISGSSTLTFDDNSANFQDHSILQQSATSHGDTIAVTMQIHNDLEINNLSATREFTISGNISANSGPSTFPIIWFNNHDTTSAAAGDIRVTGNISDGTGPEVNIVVAKGGTVTFTGTNSYSGFTEVDGGTLLINGNNSAANGGVFVYNSGTLGGTGTISTAGSGAGSVNIFGGTITGATATTVGTLTMNGNLNFGGEGPGGTYLANLSGALSDLLAIAGNLFIGSETGLTIVGSADNITTYILATFTSRTGVFDPALVTGIPAGYTLVYNATDIELVPTAIPEPSTWIGAALALGAIGWTQRRALRKKLKI